MAKFKIFAVLIVLLWLLLLWIITKITDELQYQYTHVSVSEYSWALKLLINCFGYAKIILPAFIIYKYLNKMNYFERSGKSVVSNVLFICFGETKDRLPETVKLKQEIDGGKTSLQECLGLLLCFTGLMGSYLTWGLLQEKIVTQVYVDSAGVKSHFHDSQFLVFINRLSAFILALVYLLTKKQLHINVPMYKFSYCSFSNIMSAWCQYEALKYISFPTQVLSKACKIIPVMLMGKVISKAKYEFYEYVTAIIISIGMVFFMYGSETEYTASTVTTLSGVILLALYMTFDSFTSNWQGALFTQYILTPVQMMFCVNFFSCLFTGISLMQHNGMADSLRFMLQHESFVMDCILLSLSSAIGQLFIYYTIASYGPVVFTIIMTVRQATSILLSCIVYNHYISLLGIVGITLVFIAILLRVYCRQRLRKLKTRVDV